MIRGMLNSWLRRWADASLRQELHQTQDKLIRQQEIRLNLINQSEEQAKAYSRKADERKKKNAEAASYDSKLIKALRARMSDDLFRSIAAHVRDQEVKK